MTFQDGLVDTFAKHARKGRLVYIDVKLQTWCWPKLGEEGDRYSTETLLVSGGRAQFLDEPRGNGAPAPNVDEDGDPMPDLDDGIPF